MMSKNHEWGKIVNNNLVINGFSLYEIKGRCHPPNVLEISCYPGVITGISSHLAIYINYIA